METNGRQHEIRQDKMTMHDRLMKNTSISIFPAFIYKEATGVQGIFKQNANR